MKVPPRAQQTHEQINATINAALRDDARIGELIGFARHLLATSDPNRADPPDEFWQAVEAAGELLSKTKAGEVLPRSECVRFAHQFAVIDFPRAEDGTLLPVKGELIATRIPGIEGRALWLLRGEADIEAMRRELAPGQVWIRADLVKGRRLAERDLACLRPGPARAWAGEARGSPQGLEERSPFGTGRAGPRGSRSQRRRDRQARRGRRPLGGLRGRLCARCRPGAAGQAVGRFLIPGGFRTV